MSIKVTNDANNGTVTIKGAEVAGDYTVTTPAFATELAPRMQLMTAQNSTSGTSIDFTGIPSWAKRITVMFNGVSTSGSSHLLLQLGDSGGIENTGYISNSIAPFVGSPYVSSANSTTGMCVYNSGSPSTSDGMLRLNILQGTTWLSDHIMSVANIGVLGSSSKSLSSTLDRIRVTTVNGTDTFDAGQINVLYEG